MNAKARAAALRERLLQLLRGRVPPAVCNFSLHQAETFKANCEALGRVRSYSGARLLAEYFAPIYGVTLASLDPEPVEG